MEFVLKSKKKLRFGIETFQFLQMATRGNTCPDIKDKKKKSFEIKLKHKK